MLGLPLYARIISLISCATPCPVLLSVPSRPGTVYCKVSSESQNAKAQGQAWAPVPVDQRAQKIPGCRAAGGPGTCRGIPGTVTRVASVLFTLYIYSPVPKRKSVRREDEQSGRGRAARAAMGAACTHHPRERRATRRRSRGCKQQSSRLHFYAADRTPGQPSGHGKASPRPSLYTYIQCFHTACAKPSACCGMQPCCLQIATNFG